MIIIYSSFLRMAISDIFSSTYLFSVATIVILIGGIFAYVSYRMSEQDHKLKSMVNIVSLLAQDLQFVKNKINLSHNTDTTNNLQYASEIMGGHHSSELISVSDNNEDEDDDDDDDDDDYNDDDDNSTVDDDNDDVYIEDSQEHIKLFDISLVNEDVQNNFHIENIDDEFKEVDDNKKEDIKTIHLETHIKFEEDEISVPDPEDFKVSGKDDFDLKNIPISELEELEDLSTSKLEYKKMSLNKLREIVVSKGVIADSSKLKKNEILKLLEVQ